MAKSITAKYIIQLYGQIDYGQIHCPTAHPTFTANYRAPSRITLEKCIGKSRLNFGGLGATPNLTFKKSVS